MKEPSISCGDVPNSPRFIWLRRFDAPIAIRVVSEPNSVRLIVGDPADADDWPVLA